MNKTTSGWEIPLYLSDGTYSYKFKTDNAWHEDPKNPKTLRDKSGGFNSLINVGGSIVNKNLAYYRNQLAMHELSGTRLNIIDDFINLGNGFMKTNNYTNAIQCFQKANSLYGELENHSGKADMLLNIAGAYRELSDFPHLLEYLQKARKEYEKAGNEYGLARTMREMGYYYLNLPFYLNALEFFLKALELYDRLKSKQKKQGSWAILGIPIC